MKRVMNLYDALMETAGDEQNPELTNWAKNVFQVDMEERNGWMYVGDFIQTGTMEVTLEPKLFIVLSTGGTPEQPRPIYRIVIMDADGNLERTDHHTDGRKRGWALRLRDHVLTMLAYLEIKAYTDRNERLQNETVLPVETVDFLEQEALAALATGDDVPVYPETLLTLIHHYRERMRL